MIIMANIQLSSDAVLSIISLVIGIIEILMLIILPINIFQS
jgi:hypothetical protein